MTIETLASPSAETAEKDPLAEITERQRAVVDAVADAVTWRLCMAFDIGWAKHVTGGQVSSVSREQSVINNFVAGAEDAGVDRGRAHNTILLILSQSRQLQSRYPYGELTLPEEFDPQSVIDQSRQQIDDTDAQLALLLGNCQEATRMRRYELQRKGLSVYSDEYERALYNDFQSTMLAYTQQAFPIDPRFPGRLIKPYIATTLSY